VMPGERQENNGVGQKTSGITYLVGNYK